MMTCVNPVVLGNPETSRGRILLAGSLGFLLVLAPPAAMSDPWYVEPSMVVGAGYNDNPEFALDDAAADAAEGQEFLTLGAAVVLGSSSPTGDVGIALEGQVRRYDDDSLESESWQAQFQLEESGQTTGFQLDAGASEESTLESGFADFTELSADVNRQTLFFRPSLTHRLNERWAMEAGLGYSDVSFSSDLPDTDFTDYEETSASVGVDYQLSQRTTINLSLDHLRFQPQQTPEPGEISRDVSLQFLLGADHRLSERTTLSWSLGPDFRKTTIVGEEEVSNDGSVFQLGLSVEDQANAFSAEIYRREESAATGSLLEVEGLTLSFSRRFSPLTTVSVSATAEHADPNLEGLPQQDRVEFTASLARELSRNFTLGLDLFHRELEIDPTVDSPAGSGNQSGILLELNYRWNRRTF